MGLFGLFGTKTKADWDREIISLQTRLAEAKASYASNKAWGCKNGLDCRPAALHDKQLIAQLQAQIANAKIQRKNAPK